MGTLVPPPPPTANSNPYSAFFDEIGAAPTQPAQQPNPYSAVFDAMAAPTPAAPTPLGTKKAAPIQPAPPPAPPEPRFAVPQLPQPLPLTLGEEPPKNLGQQVVGDIANSVGNTFTGITNWIEQGGLGDIGKGMLSQSRAHVEEMHKHQLPAQVAAGAVGVAHGVPKLAQDLYNATIAQAAHGNPATFADQLLQLPGIRTINQAMPATVAAGSMAGGMAAPVFGPEMAAGKMFAGSPPVLKALAQIFAGAAGGAVYNRAGQMGEQYKNEGYVDPRQADQATLEGAALGAVLSGAHQTIDAARHGLTNARAKPAESKPETPAPPVTPPDKPADNSTAGAPTPAAKPVDTSKPPARQGKRKDYDFAAPEIKAKLEADDQANRQSAQPADITPQAQEQVPAPAEQPQFVDPVSTLQRSRELQSAPTEQAQTQQPLPPIPDFYQRLMTDHGIEPTHENLERLAKGEITLKQPEQVSQNKTEPVDAGGTSSSPPRAESATTAKPAIHAELAESVKPNEKPAENPTTPQIAETKTETQAASASPQKPAIPSDKKLVWEGNDHYIAQEGKKYVLYRKGDETPLRWGQDKKQLIASGEKHDSGVISGRGVRSDRRKLTDLKPSVDENAPLATSYQRQLDKTAAPNTVPELDTALREIAAAKANYDQARADYRNVEAAVRKAKGFSIKTDKVRKLSPEAEAIIRDARHDPTVGPDQFGIEVNADRIAKGKAYAPKPGAVNADVSVDLAEANRAMKNAEAAFKAVKEKHLPTIIEHRSNAPANTLQVAHEGANYNIKYTAKGDLAKKLPEVGHVQGEVEPSHNYKETQKLLTEHPDIAENLQKLGAMDVVTNMLKESGTGYVC